MLRGYYQEWSLFLIFQPGSEDVTFGLMVFVYCNYFFQGELTN